MYKLACPSCRHITEHDFLRVGARVQCEDCQSIYVIDKKYIRHKVRLVRLNAQSDLTFGDLAEYYYEAVAQKKKRKDRKAQKQITDLSQGLMAQDAGGATKQETSGLGRGLVGAKDFVWDCFLKRKIWGVHLGIFLSGLVGLVIVLFVTSSIDHQIKLQDREMSGQSTLPYRLTAKEMRHEHFELVEAASFKLLKWQTQGMESIKSRNGIGGTIHFRQDNFRKIEGVLFFSGQIAHHQSKNIWVKGLVLSLVMPGGEVFAQAKAKPFILLKNQKLLIRTQIPKRLERMGMQWRWHIGEITDVVEKVSLSLTDGKPFVKNGQVYLMLKVVNDNAFAVKNIQMVVREHDQMGVGLQQWRCLLPGKLEPKGHRVFAIKVKDISDLTQMHLWAVGLAQKISPDMNGKH